MAMSETGRLGIDWRCSGTWGQARINTLWCLLGCSIGDFGTILFFQVTGIPWPVWAIMGLAILNGLMTSIALETVILSRQMGTRDAFRTAIGMSLISMIAMEAAMMVGGADHVVRRLDHAPAVQLLAAEGAGQGLLSLRSERAGRGGVIPASRSAPAAFAPISTGACCCPAKCARLRGTGRADPPHPPPP